MKTLRYISIWVQPLAVLRHTDMWRPQHGGRAEVLKEEIVANIVNFPILSFPYSFELTYFLQRKCLDPFLCSMRQLVVDVLSCEFKPTKM